jgi:hypothetical protein
MLALSLAAISATAAHAGTRPNDRAGVLGVGAQPIEQAATRPNDRAGVLGVGAQPIADSSVGVSRYLRSDAIRPNDRAGSLGANPLGGNPAYASSPDVFERYASAHPYGSGLAATSVAASSGFRWDDYGAGFGTGIVTALLLAGAVLATPRRRQRTQPAVGR